MNTVASREKKPVRRSLTMAFLDDIKRIGKSIGDKSKDVIEITKLSTQIGTEKDKIRDLYVKIGEAVYKSHAAGENTEFEEFCGQIGEIEANIKELSAKVLELKNAAKCPNCGAEVTKDTAFCPKCGTKINE